jgi:hypothetical protein
LVLPSPRSLTVRYTDALEQSQEEHGYRELREQIEPLVEQVIANGLYEVVQSRTAASEAGA